ATHTYESMAAAIMPLMDATDLPMIMFHLVDLRTHLRPVARADEVTNALGFAPTVTACGLSTDLEVLAAQAKTQIVAGIRTGAALTVMRAAAGNAAHGGPRKGVGNFLTNWGVVPDLAVPAGVEIVDFHGFATSEPVSWVGYFVSTFAGRAALELAFSPRFHVPAQIAALRALICANLAELTVRARSR
uniref:phthiocerol/phthiodiolone dimycocerosyl transferase family protein n=1 Tax=Nocardia brasiliensis TaxID=37326 RepID=UPI0024552932